MTKRWTRGLPVLGALLVWSAAILPAPAAHAQQLLIESFTHGAVSNPAAWVSGGSGATISGWPGQSCLSAGDQTSQTPIAGCGLDPADGDGSGALRLTAAQGSSAGFALYNKALPTTGGLDITFDQAQYGGSGADGISFFLVDGSADLTEPGAQGGGLGYTAGNDGGGNYSDGVTHGLLAVGIDKWGNFSAPTSSGSGCAAGTGSGSQGPGQTPNVVSIRGEGNGTVGYCWLANSADLGTTLSGVDRTKSTALVHIVIDPDTVVTRHITVSLNGTQVIQIPITQALLDATSFKFGFAGSTGAVTDIHEVWNLSINSVIPVPSSTTTTSATTTTTAAEAVETTPAFTG